MIKRLIIILVSSFLGIVGAPEILMASDDYDLTGLNGAGITETIQVIEEVAEEEPAIVAEEPAPESVYQAPAQAMPAPEPVYQEPVLPASHIIVGGRTIEIIDSNDTKNDAGRYVARYNASFLYGHNSSTVFDVLYGVRIGEAFTVVYNGITTTYRIQDIVIYRKTGETTLRVDDASSSIDGEDVPMKYIAKGQEKYMGAQHDVALMTCYGTSYGNGDASHRLVVFADAI